LNPLSGISKWMPNFGAKLPWTYAIVCDITACVV